MLRVTVRKLGNIAVLQLQGAIVVGDECRDLRRAALRAGSGTLILDLAEVDRVDAGGLGVLLELRAAAEERESHLKLLNLRPAVQQIFSLTALDGVFERCTFEDWMIFLCDRGAANVPEAVVESSRYRIAESAAI